MNDRPDPSPGLPVTVQNRADRFKRWANEWQGVLTIGAAVIGFCFVVYYFRTGPLIRQEAQAAVKERSFMAEISRSLRPYMNVSPRGTNGDWTCVVDGGALSEIESVEFKPSEVPGRWGAIQVTLNCKHPLVSPPKITPFHQAALSLATVQRGSGAKFQWIYEFRQVAPIQGELLKDSEEYQELFIGGGPGRDLYWHKIPNFTFLIEPLL